MESHRWKSLIVWFERSGVEFAVEILFSFGRYDMDAVAEVTDETIVLEYVASLVMALSSSIPNTSTRMAMTATRSKLMANTRYSSTRSVTKLRWMKTSLCLFKLKSNSDFNYGPYTTSP